MNRSEIEVELATLVGQGTEPTPYDTKMLIKLITRSSALLLDRIERELPEEATNRREFLMISDKGLTDEQIYTVTKHRQAGFNRAIAQTKATIDKIRRSLNDE